MAGLEFSAELFLSEFHAESNKRGLYHIDEYKPLTEACQLWP